MVLTLRTQARLATFITEFLAKLSQVPLHLLREDDK